MEINVDLEKFIEDKIREVEHKIREVDLRQDIKRAAVEKALELQAGKDKDHFAELNHAKALLQEDRQRYLPRETYAADRKDKMAATLSIVSIIVSVLLFIVSRLLEN